MTSHTADERGAAMVLALGVIAVLTVLALVVVSIVVTEKKTALADYSNTRSFYSADAAAEAGVSWVRRQTIPPPMVDGNSNVLVQNTYTSLSSDHLYKYNVQYVAKRPRAGWGMEFKDYEYSVQATGTSALASESAIELHTTLLFREGY